MFVFGALTTGLSVLFAGLVQSISGFFDIYFLIPSKQCVGCQERAVEWAFDNVKNGKMGRSPFFATDLPGGLLGFRLLLLLLVRELFDRWLCAISMVNLRTWPKSGIGIEGLDI